MVILVRDVAGHHVALRQLWIRFGSGSHSPSLDERDPGRDRCRECCVRIHSRHDLSIWNYVARRRGRLSHPSVQPSHQGEPSAGRDERDLADDAPRSRGDGSWVLCITPKRVPWPVATGAVRDGRLVHGCMRDSLGPSPHRPHRISHETRRAACRTVGRCTRVP